MPSSIYTIGHSTQSIEEFTRLLKSHGIDLLVDVRRHPGSRRHPQFNEGNLSESLQKADIDYRHMEELGGRRGKPEPISPNDGWERAGFQAYADYLNTPQGQKAVDKLQKMMESNIPAIMCAEAVFWRCHRQIIADALVTRGIDVVHILDKGEAQIHSLNDMAKVLDDGRLIYPDPSGQQDLFDS